MATRANRLHEINTTADLPDDFAREVYGVLGIPIDVVDMAAVVRRIESAAAKAQPFLISTANLNFLIASQTDAEFRRSLLNSDLCIADGMPVVRIARLLGVPIKERVAGSDLFEFLKSRKDGATALKVFFFGGAEGAAAAACKKINSESKTMTCVGYYEPGFGSADEMSTDAIIEAINESKADFLAVALGAKKGQSWLLRNHSRLRIPVRVHLGATINFQAGSIRRAPTGVQRLGLEWLWRIKEEPQLWRRYWGDGFALLRLCVSHVLPILISAFWHRLKQSPIGTLGIERAQDHKFVTLSLNGDAVARNVRYAVPIFRDAAVGVETFAINFTATRLIDARFLGLLVVLRKHLEREGGRLAFTGMSPRIARIFRNNGFDFLLHG